MRLPIQAALAAPLPVQGPRTEPPAMLPGAPAKAAVLIYEAENTGHQSKMWD